MNTTEELHAARTILQAIITDLPQKRDWLDPDVEKAARNFLAAPMAMCGDSWVSEPSTVCVLALGHEAKEHRSRDGKTWITEPRRCMFCQDSMDGGPRCSHCGAL